MNGTLPRNDPLLVETRTRDGVNFVRRGTGAPVILVHGLAASLHDWDDILPVLESAGYAGYALDLLGHGESRKPARLEEYSVENVFRQMEGWIDSLSLDGPAAMVGHSLGGYLILLYALRHPGRVRQLILVNPFFDLSQLSASLRAIFRHPLINTALIERTPYWLFRLLVDASSLRLGNSGAGGHALPGAMRVQTALDYKRAAPGIYNIPRTLRDLTPDLPRLGIPALVVWGVHDQTLALPSFTRLVELLPGGRGLAIPACGHVPHRCHPAEFNRLVVEFLRGTSPQPVASPE